MTQAKTAKSSRRCWWCGVGPTPDNRLTNEHIIAEWFSKAMRGDGRLTHAYREHGAIEDARRWQSDKPSFKAGVVCERCNNEWMSDLEVAAEQLLPAFMRAEPRLALTYENAPALARWAAKTCLMFQGAELAGNRVVPPDHYPLLRASQVTVLPSIMRVWIGAVADTGARSTAFGGSIDLAHQPVAFYTVLLAIDHVVFLIIGADERDALAHIKLGDLADRWTALWPMTEPAAWPPGFVWSTEELLQLAPLMEAASRQAALRAPDGLWIPRRAVPRPA